MFLNLNACCLYTFYKIINDGVTESSIQNINSAMETWKCGNLTYKKQTSRDSSGLLLLLL